MDELIGFVLYAKKMFLWRMFLCAKQKKNNGQWRSLVAFLNGVQAVEGSNPFCPSNSMACRQSVRHRILVPAFGGSNPPRPAKLFDIPVIYGDCSLSGKASPKNSGGLDLNVSHRHQLSGVMWNETKGSSSET